MDNYKQTSQGITEQIQIGTMHHNLSDLMPTSSEVGHLWDAYLAESMSVCFLKKWVHDAKDPEIRPLLQLALDSSTNRVQTMENIFNSINYLIPLGFGEKDVNINAPALFSETFSCLYMRMTQKMIIHHYASATTTSYRSDFLNFYSDCLRTSMDIHKKATEILLGKGILQKAPIIVTPKSLTNVEDKDYLGFYFRVFGDQRPLNATEIDHIYSMMETKQLVRTLNLGCSQIVKSNKIRKFLLKEIEVADKQLEFLGKLLTDQDIPRPSLSEFLITDTQEPGISDRLILTHTTAIVAYITTGYGLAIPEVARKDISTTMMKFTAECLGLAKDGAELMIKLGWLERSPETADRKKLTH